MPLPNNLDYFVAGAALGFTPRNSDDKQKKETGVQKAISVLSSQGLFAMFLWSYSKDDYAFVAKEFVKIFRNAELVTFQQNEKTRDILTTLKKELQSFEKIRFLEELAMRILTYARHYLKSV